MRLADLSEQVSIVTPTVTDTADGGTETTWALYAEVWAKIEELTGREYLTARQVSEDVLARITVHYDSAIVSTMAIVEGWGLSAAELAVPDWGLDTGLNPHRDNEFLVLMARKLVD